MSNEEFEYIGTITGKKSFRGVLELKDVPKGIEKLKEGASILVGFSPKFAKNFTLQKFKNSKKSKQIKFKEINDDNTFSQFLEKGVFISRDDILTNEDEALVDEIIGCIAIDNSTKEQLGKIIDVWYLPGNDVWVCKTTKGDLPLPVTNEVILSTDFEKEEILVNIIDGLWDLVEG